MMTETFYHSLCMWRIENLIKRLCKDISKPYIAIMIHTTRHQTSIRKNTNLLMESLAEYFGPLPLRGTGGGAVELLATQTSYQTRDRDYHIDDSRLDAHAKVFVRISPEVA